jgi:hypothetical protein
MYLTSSVRLILFVIGMRHGQPDQTYTVHPLKNKNITLEAVVSANADRF